MVRIRPSTKAGSSAIVVEHAAPKDKTLGEGEFSGTLVLREEDNERKARPSEPY
jgi:hypothetical protein